MTRLRLLLAAFAAGTAVGFAPVAVAQVGPSPLPPLPPELAPVTDLLPPLGDEVCGTIDGTVPTAIGELLGPFIVVICPPTTYPPFEPPVEEEPVIDPVPTVVPIIEPVTPLAPPVAASIPARSTVTAPATCAGRGSVASPNPAPSDADLSPGGLRLPRRVPVPARPPGLRWLRRLVDESTHGRAAQMTVGFSVEDAERLAAEAGVEVGLLTRMDELAEAIRLFESVWGLEEGHALPGELLRAISFAGGYVSGARRDGVLVGASVGFLGRHDGELHLHSHISGVLPEVQGRHVGLALKQHQRAWALSRGIAMIEWTFDPLVRRNAYFNLIKLGARVVGYEPAFYGAMHDAFNEGDETDRAVIRWRLDAPAAASEHHDGAVILRGRR